MCGHKKLVCLECGDEGTPAHFLAARTSKAKALASRENGKKGGRPEKIIVGILALLCFCAPVHAEEWTKLDTSLQVVYTVAHCLDWAQTRQISRHYGQMTGYQQHNDGRTTFAVNQESNGILGPHPSRDTVDLYFASTLVAHTAIAYILPKPYRNIWQAVWIGVEVETVRHNYSVGVQARF